MTPKPDIWDDRGIVRVNTAAAQGYTGPSKRPTIAYEYTMLEIGENVSEVG